MEIYAKKFCLPKHGSSRAEYEDASSISKDKLRFAIADGATETSFSGVWAKQLVRAFTRRQLSVPLVLQELRPLQSRWAKIVRRSPLPWYAEEKLNSGAFAAFVGLELLQPHATAQAERQWIATAAGDSCLIQMRGDQILAGFPLTDSVSFTNRPNLLSSTPALVGDELVINCNGCWGCDDIFFLMTDALACWFFKERELGKRPWELLRDLDTEGHQSFEKLVADMRSSGQMKNDDVTLVRIDIVT